MRGRGPARLPLDALAAFPAAQARGPLCTPAVARRVALALLSSPVKPSHRQCCPLLPPRRYVGDDVSPDFYGWVFPKYDHVAVGTGTVVNKTAIKQ